MHALLKCCGSIREKLVKLNCWEMGSLKLEFYDIYQYITYQN